ncbi:MAG TPA: hypothetical protein VFU41_04215 [Gemmatimonadales bacterium]|nr:hypothetical protein [Gemmatimonadales bacterium]
MNERLLHILNGDSTAAQLRRSDVPGTLAVWADVLYEGPVPGEDATPEQWREVRAGFASQARWATYDEALRRYTEWDEGLERYREFEEVVLWFEHDLFDQLILARHLDWFARRDLGRTRLSLICIGHFPGVEPFHGLGQLSPAQLASLLRSRQPVTTRQSGLGRAAWQAFTGPDPAKLERLLERDTSALPFLAGALRRLLQEFPAVTTGLPRTERHILEAVGDAPRGPADLFRAVQAKEERVFMSDATFWGRVQQLADGAKPLVTLEVRDREPHRLPEGLVRITAQGREVLAGRDDWVRLDGIDRWLGGVHLVGQVPWRWDESAGRLRPVPS